MRRWGWVLALSAGCLKLDGFVFNGVPCSTVGPETCEGHASPWDAVCVTCDEPYDWGRDYPWMEGTLAPGQVVRAVPEERVRQLRVATADGEGELDVYVLEGHGEDPRLAGATLVYNHGNYAGIEHYQPRLRMLYELGLDIVVWDYRGFGKSTPDSAPSPEQFLEDARQVRELATELAVDPGRVIVYANSLGGIPAVEMALHEAPCALVLEAPFTSLEAVARSQTTLSFGDPFFSDGLFDNVGKLQGYPGAVFAMIGSEDNKFPVEDIEEMLAGVTGPRELWVLEGVKHGIANGGVPEAGLTPYLERIRAFLERDAPTCLGPG